MSEQKIRAILMAITLDIAEIYGTPEQLLEKILNMTNEFINSRKTHHDSSDG